MFEERYENGTYRVKGLVYGENVTLPGGTVSMGGAFDLTIPDGASLTVPARTSLNMQAQNVEEWEHVDAGRSTITIEPGGRLINHGTIANGGDITNEGTLQNYGAITNEINADESPGTLTNDGTIENYGAITNEIDTSIWNVGALTNNGTIKNYCGALPDIGLTNSGEVLHAAKVAVAADPNPFILGESEGEGEKPVTLTATATHDGEPVTGGTVTFYQGDAEEGNELGEQPANVTNGMATCTIDASNWEIADYTITAVHTPAEGDGPVQLVGTGSAVLTVLAEVPETYYWIGTAQELADFRDMVNNGETNARTTATLTADIDLEGKPWEPILNYAGTFDGQGHTIKGLYVSSSTGHAGLFGTVTGGTVKNLAVEGTVTADRGNAEISSYTGGVVGENSGAVINCAFSGEVTDSSNANQDTTIAAGSLVRKRRALRLHPRHHGGHERDGVLPQHQLDQGPGRAGSLQHGG